MADISKARLRPQSYGIACAQTSFGGPRGIWLECLASGCQVSDVIVGSRLEDGPYRNITDAQAASVFRRHGWTGEGAKMLKARCPKCSAEQKEAA